MRDEKEKIKKGAKVQKNIKKDRIMETQKVGARNKQSTDLTLSKLTKWKVGLLRCS